MTETPALQPTAGLPCRGMHAPEPTVWMVAALAPQPNPGPTGEPTAEQWRSQVRRVVDAIWREAWVAGAAYAASTQPTRIVIEATQLAARGVDPPDDLDDDPRLWTTP